MINNEPLGDCNGAEIEGPKADWEDGALGIAGFVAAGDVDSEYPESHHHQHVMPFEKSWQLIVIIIVTLYADPKTLSKMDVGTAKDLDN